MEQAINAIENEPQHTVEIVVHISETLGEERRSDLVSALGRNEISFLQNSARYATT